MKLIYTNHNFHKGVLTINLENDKKIVIDLNQKTLYGVSGKPIKKTNKDYIKVFYTAREKSDYGSVLYDMFNLVTLVGEPSTKDLVNLLRIYEAYANIGIRLPFNRLSLTPMPNEIEKTLLAFWRQEAYKNLGYSEIKSEYMFSHIPVEFRPMAADLLPDRMVDWKDEDIQRAISYCQKVVRHYPNLIKNSRDRYEIKQILVHAYRKKVAYEKLGYKLDLSPQTALLDYDKMLDFEQVLEEKAFTAILEKRINPQLKWENEEYFTTQPTSFNDIYDEQTQQRNCLGRTYAMKYVHGECQLVFIRRKNNPTGSFVTVELSPTNTIRQFKGYRNQTDAEIKKVQAMYEKHLRGI